MCRKKSGLFLNIPKFYKGFPMETLIEFGDVSKKSGNFSTHFFEMKKKSEKSSQKIFEIPMSIGNCSNFRKIILRKSLEQAKRAKNNITNSYIFFRNLTNPVVPPGDML